MHCPKINLRQMVATILMLSVGSFSNLLLTSALAQDANQNIKGELTSIRGTVTLNGFAVKNGAVLQSNSRIETGVGASAIINLGQKGQLVLGENSVFVLRAEAAEIGGDLRNGCVTTYGTSGIATNVVTADATSLTNGSMKVDVNCGNTYIAALANETKVTGAGKTEVVAAGTETTVGAQNNSRCPRVATISGAGAAGAAGALTGGALAALLLVGVGATVAGIVAATQGGDVSSSSIVVSPIR